MKIAVLATTRVTTHWISRNN